jgi:hypothetical protein
MASASRRRAEEQYSWQVVIRRHEALWSELAAQARAAPGSSGDGGRYSVPDYGRFFGHFASRQLDDGTALQLTAHGRDVIRGQDALRLQYVERWRHLEPALLERVLKGLALADEKGTLLTVERILAVMTRSDASPGARDVVLRHVLFLLKYGLAREAVD